MAKSNNPTYANKKVRVTDQKFAEDYYKDGKRKGQELGKPKRKWILKACNHIQDLPGVVHERFDVVMNLVANRIPVYMVGPAGVGKNHLAEQVAQALGLDFYCMNSVTDEFKVTGYMDANGVYRESEFYRAFVYGGLFFLDELDASAPDVLVCLNMAIANGYFTFPCGRVKAHPDFRVVAAGNTWGTGADASYTGRYQLDAASLNRFATVEVDYDARIDEMMAGGDRSLVEFAHDFRKAAKKVGLDAPFSYRNIKMLAVMSQFATKEEAVASCVKKSMNPDDVNAVVRAMDTEYSNDWTKALKSLGA